VSGGGWWPTTPCSMSGAGVTGVVADHPSRASSREAVAYRFFGISPLTLISWCMGRKSTPKSERARTPANNATQARAGERCTLLRHQAAHKVLRSILRVPLLCDK